MKTSILVGMTFGKWTVVSRSRNVGHHIVWKCVCACGNESEVYGNNLLEGKSSSCGCYRKSVKVTHGQCYGITYRSWQNMLARCQNPNREAYRHYGDRGIFVCERWKAFENFIEDMGERPSIKYTIERENNSKGYYPGNCVWATRPMQMKNTRSNVRITAFGRTQILADWARETGVQAQTIRYRIFVSGHSPEEAMRLS